MVQGLQPLELGLALVVAVAELELWEWQTLGMVSPNPTGWV